MIQRLPSRLTFYLLLGLVLVGCLSILAGRYPSPGLISPGEIRADPLAQNLIWNLRLPRVLVAALLGMTLAASGTVFQMIFANPLVEPGFLGVSQGAAFGAALSILVVGNQIWSMQISAGFFGVLGLTLSYLLARRVRFGGWVLRLILSGIAISALFSAGVGILKYLADPLRQLPDITYWMLGGLWGASWERLGAVLPAALVSLLIIYRMRWRLNLLSLDDETAASLGISPVRERTLLLGAAVAATAALISVSGMVGWVGLIIPHITRRLFGADSRHTIPAAILLGGAFTVLCDDLARLLLPGELPLGILTSLAGAVVFITMMISHKIKVER